MELYLELLNTAIKIKIQIINMNIAKCTMQEHMFYKDILIQAKNRLEQLLGYLRLPNTPEIYETSQFEDIPQIPDIHSIMVPNPRKRKLNL